MQTKKGTAAKGPTAEEFLHVMTYFKSEAMEVARKHPHVFGRAALTGDIKLKFSFDNLPIHKDPSLGQLEIEKVPLPPRSPDMHKVIEHIFGTLTRAMNLSLATDPTLNTTAKYKAELERLFAAITPESVRKDVESLPATFKCIADDVKGGWPPARLR